MRVQTPAVTMSSLPNELLAAIAAAGQEDRVHWTLSHISRRFRTVMLGTPTLWTVIQVDLHSEGSVNILQLYLERSQACFISATLQHRSRLRHESKDLISERLDQIVVHINRISWLKVVVGHWGGEFMLTPFRHLAALNLRHLEVVKLSQRRGRGPIELFSVGAPALRFLKLHDQQLRLPLPQWATSLTHLELWQYYGPREDGTSEVLYEFLGGCSSLVHLCLDISDKTLERRVRFPFLETLYLKVSGTEDDFDLLATVLIFDTPSLTELAIKDVHGDQIIELLSTKSLTHTSFPALTSLYFASTDECACERSIPFPEKNSLPPFQLFPALSSLSLINICSTENLLKGVAVPTSELWPILGTIALSPGTTDLGGVRDVVSNVMLLHHLHGLLPPTFKLSSTLLNLEDWQEHSIDAKIFETFDPADVLEMFQSR
ncbi:hypothetical protein B0H12DRAFT_1155087 [Mycena haematopus]|nr:hypothetical protein B0H12DRAFT_1155087 [Mycena haematopus]